ncbi:hypothetical protein ANCDUO_02232 [Ancylostoma duodenale]|uniref:Uncharacterized protein n=1 Tax=Ancylostoma duodenale TaxID=51022 RepID=A0A0C2DC69_9BILA|nr:hypothetical protein ANCDUO_02232 [Ancylostoma duodenale]
MYIVSKSSTKGKDQSQFFEHELCSNGIVHHGIRRRAIREPSPELLDQKAAEEIFGEEDKWSRPHQACVTPKRRVFQPGPPAPPDPVLYNKQFAVAPSKVQSEVQHEPAIFSKQTRYLPPTSRVTPFDSDVDPNFPADAPRARGLVGEGSQAMVDVEFRTGYRWRALLTPVNPSSDDSENTVRVSNSAKLFGACNCPSNIAAPVVSFHRTFEIGPRGRETNM